VFESRVMKKTFGTKREAVTKENCRKLRNEEFRDMYFSPDIVQDEVGVVYDTCKRKRDACRVAVGTPADNIKVNLKQIRWRGIEWINLA